MRECDFLLAKFESNRAMHIRIGFLGAHKTVDLTASHPRHNLTQIQ